MTARHGALRVLAASALASSLLVVASSPARAEGSNCVDIDDETQSEPVDGDDEPMQEMLVAEAHLRAAQEGRGLGAGVGVAVVDSGIATNVDGLPVVGTYRNKEFSSAEDLAYYHGTAVAGLISGPPRAPEGSDDQARPVGIAPEAGLFDVRVYDQPVADDGSAISDDSGKSLTTDGLVDGLEWVRDEGDAQVPRIKVVNISLAVERTPELDTVIRDLAAKGIIVVASSGNRPAEDDDPLLGEYAYGTETRPPGEDARNDVWPAGYANVLTVSTTVPEGGDAGEVALLNSATDLAAPTEAGVSYGLNGSSCILDIAATSWAAAEVSGIVALLWSYYGVETPAAEIVERLLRTATGSGEATNVLTGHGIVQPLSALRRPLRLDNKSNVEANTIDDDENRRAEVPQPQADVLASTRENAVWWGLVGGGALVVAVLLRPVLARRRK